MAQHQTLWTSSIVRTAIVDSFRKLNPRTMAKNPVMFVVEVGSVVTAALLIADALHYRPIGFNLQITLWLWFTVLFANFAEAVAEGRGKAQADTLRRAKAETMAQRYRADGTTEAVSSTSLRLGDVIRRHREQCIGIVALLGKRAYSAHEAMAFHQSRRNVLRYVNSRKLPHFLPFSHNSTRTSYTFASLFSPLNAAAL